MTNRPPPVAGLTLDVGDPVTPGWRVVAEVCGVSPDAILLAAHARVLRALSGERQIIAWYRSNHAWPYLLTVSDGSWRDLVQAAHRAILAGPAQSFDPAGPPCWMVRRDDWATIGFRTGVHATTAHRIVGYHQVALAALAADPDAEHHRCGLLSAEEICWQLTELAGPRRPRPDARAHQLIEERVRRHPAAVAAVSGSQTWTYAELNRRANRIGRALLANRARPEEVVAVVTERNLDWLATVLGVLKAGGCYLPVEPGFPVDRVAVMLRRSAARFVVGAPAHLTRLGSAGPATREATVLSIPDMYSTVCDDSDLGVSVGADQLAYIYFTSGSTGEPKGAMCEHAGMLNHLLAKVEDLDIIAGTRVAQTAPQCFDISLWQLLAPLLAGGRTHIIEPEAIADPARFVEVVVAGGVEVVQLVPSYLEELLHHLGEVDTAIPALRCISVTGETVNPGVVERCLRRFPTIKLLNAYGLTETSDDTNHEVLDRVPRGPVPVGRPIPNVRVHILDENRCLVPFGAPGEIAFSGVCVGRGYVNDAERTRQAFLPDPYVAGQRLYLSGDHGRWLPDGRLAFLGRMDTQVKIRGFRVELEEVESRMLGLAGVRASAVVVTTANDGRLSLAAFYAGAAGVTANALRDHLGRSLPEYMVPDLLHRLDALPLTGNGKVDRKALTRLADGLRAAGGEPPRTPTEQRLVAVWAELLDLRLDQVGRATHFFAAGGTSLSAVRLVVALGRRLSLRDVADHPVLADLANALDRVDG